MSNADPWWRLCKTRPSYYYHRLHKVRPTRIHTQEGYFAVTVGILTVKSNSQRPELRLARRIQCILHRHQQKNRYVAKFSSKFSSPFNQQSRRQLRCGLLQWKDKPKYLWRRSEPRRWRTEKYEEVRDHYEDEGLSFVYVNGEMEFYIQVIRVRLRLTLDPEAREAGRIIWLFVNPWWHVMAFASSYFLLWRTVFFTVVAMVLCRSFRDLFLCLRDNVS